jgi:hypothetical protein
MEFHSAEDLYKRQKDILLTIPDKLYLNITTGENENYVENYLFKSKNVSIATIGSNLINKLLIQLATIGVREVVFLISKYQYLDDALSPHTTDESYVELFLKRFVHKLRPTFKVSFTYEIEEDCTFPVLTICAQNYKQIFKNSLSRSTVNDVYEKATMATMLMESGAIFNSNDPVTNTVAQYKNNTNFLSFNNSSVFLDTLTGSVGYTSGSPFVLTKFIKKQLKSEMYPVADEVFLRIALLLVINMLCKHTLYDINSFFFVKELMERQLTQVTEHLNGLKLPEYEVKGT